MGGAWCPCGTDEDCVQILNRKTHRNRLLGRRRCRWEAMNRKEVGCEGVDWIKLMQDIVQWHIL
jgi:hypothetical protein